MIHLTRSHNLTILSGALAEKLAETSPDDPFTSQNILVPNLDTARWFKLFAAEKNGIAANLECLLPAEWVWRQIRKIYPGLPEHLPSDLQPMKWRLFELLSNSEVRKKFPALDSYVQSQPGERREQAVFQLAGKIASVFDEYLVYRPEMIVQWQNGHRGKGDEKWQAELWRLLNQSWKSSNDDSSKNRAELYGEVMEALSNQEIETEDSIYVLNPGLLPLPIIKMLKKTGEKSNVYIYQIELSKATGKNRNELYQIFGKESESIHEIINSLGPDQTTDIHPEISQNHSINRIQSQILNGNSTSGFSVNNGGIQGIEIRSCHSMLREIEVLHQFLLEKFEEDENLQPDDILVATPDLETYRPFIKAVFDEAENHLPKIPYHAGYSKRSSKAGVERTLIRLLLVIDSRFEFSNVIDLFMMNPVYQSFGISESECSKLKQWIEENHVVWGLDAEHRKEFGQPAEELQTWNSALRRGWYGQLLGGEEGDMVGDLLLYQSIRTTNDQQIWAAFSSYLHKLDKIQKEQKGKRSCGDWCDWLMSRLESLFDDRSLASVEAQNVFRIIGQISEQSSIAESSEKISYSLFRGELTSMLDRPRASGALFTNGVTFSSMVPVRSIPFKVIALIGLNENIFPRKQVTPDFDLMTQNPIPGERNRKNEDRNLFLESIMAAGEIHYCSYIGQSQVDNEEIPPSTIVSEWADLLSKTSGMGADDIIQKESLSGFSPINFESGRSYSESYFQTAQNLIEEEGAISGLKLNQPIPLEEAESSESIPLDDLIRFCSNPIQWFLRKRFEVTLWETDQEKDEFTLDHLEQHILFQRIFGWILGDMPVQQIQKYLVQSGAVPVGWSGERETLRIQNSVSNAISVMNQHGFEPKQCPHEVSLYVSGRHIEGSVISYSDDQFIDLNPSGLSGKSLLQSWIKHLCMQASGIFAEKRSILFCDLKKGEPDKRIFKSVQDPENILGEWIAFYHQGLTTPQYFFPKTLYTFEEKERDQKTTDPYKQAAAVFDGGWFRGEKEDRFIQALLGAEVSFQTEFITDQYREFIGKMMSYMEEA